jgi:hypothetical protein
VTIPTSPSQILDGLSERAMLEIMRRYNIACRVEAFRDACREIQNAALRERTRREVALDEMTRANEELGLYDEPCTPKAPLSRSSIDDATTEEWTAAAKSAMEKA